MLFLVVASALFVVLVIYAGTLYVTKPGTMSDQWLAQYRASRTV